MKNRQGQALIIVVIIIAVIMAVFANSLNTQLRYHAQEETEICQREQALYLAEMGINQMIFNINNGTTYNDGDTITGNFSDIGNYTAIYHTPDDSGFGGSSYIESIGTAGEISRKIFASVQSGGGSRDAFKYCLFTSTGGNDGVDDANFHNYIWNVPTEYKYNLPPGSTTPHPDMTKYSSNYDKGYYFTGNSATYQPFEWGDNNKVVYIEAKGTPPTTLTIDFQDNEEIQLSLATNATNLIIKNMSGSFQWKAAHEFEGHTFPIITHSGTGKVQFNFNDFFENLWQTLYLQGFIYTAGYISMKYLNFFGIPISYGEIDGEVIEKNPQGKLGGSDGQSTSINYTVDYYTNPPPYFIVPNGLTSVSPGSFREEY